MSTGSSKLKLDPQKFRILMIEDCEINVHILLDILGQAGYQVDYSLTGEEGLLKVSKAKPDLILLDVVMPNMNGFQICKILKANPNTANIPIIFMTAETDIVSIVHGFELGAVDYIKKPIQTREILARIETHLTIRDLQLGLSKEIVEREELISDLSAFTHMVAHDLKNPASNILGFVEILMADREKLDEKTVLDTLSYIRQSGQKVYQIIDSLLLLANVRLEEVDYEPFDMNLLITEAKARLAHQLHTQKVTFRAPEVWPMVMGYAPWVEEVLVNLISNAIKYGGLPPQIEIGFEPIETGYLKVNVMDNGAGLTLEQQSLLFQPFVKLHSSRQGHGLGLSIVRRIIEKLGGDVGASSKVGQGSTFYFTLPLAKSDPCR